MALDTSSFPAYLRSLNLKGPVNTRPGRIVAGPPAPIMDLILRLGLGPFILDTARNRDLLANLGLHPRLLRLLARRLRSRTLWRPVLEDLAHPFMTAAENLAARGEHEQALENAETALTLLNLALTGDGYYFYVPMRERRGLIHRLRRLYALRRKLKGEPTERLRVRHARGQTTGLLHLPPGARGSGRRVPAVLAFHPLGCSKDVFDSLLGCFREAGYATFCVDLPGHGENFKGPRLAAADESVGVAALEVLANHPAIDPQRLGVMGGSLGAFFALRTAAASPLVKACLAYASPYDLGFGMESTLPGVVDCFAWVVGARTKEEVRAVAKEFHLRDAAERIKSPLCLVHGTQDHVCDFTASYHIASRVTAPVTVHPLIGVDHDAALPGATHIASPGVDWLKQHL